MEENKLRTEFISKLIESRAAVTIFLMNGVKLQGKIESYDGDGLILEHKGHRQLVFRHAISTIMPTFDNTPLT